MNNLSPKTKVMRKFTLLLFAIAISAHLFGQYEWIKHPENPLIGPGSNGEWDEGWIWGGSVLHYKDL